FAANGDGASTATAKASAKGADKQKEQDKGNTTADQQTAKQKALADSKSGKTNNVGQTATDGSGGTVSVAAALAINVSHSDALASLPAGVTVVAGDGAASGALTVSASNNMDAAAIADGSAATGESGTAVGIAVAINVPTMTNRAVVNAGATATGD